MSGADDIDIDPSLPSALGASAIGAAASSDAITPASTSAAADPSEAIRGDAAIARALAAGRIDAVAAQELLLAEVVAEQLPLDASPETIARLSTQLRELLAGDPTLARLLARA